ncbi:flagellar hook-associated protein FlgK [Comamonas flocculans]|uniref:Flagellar hook-associated protein 1 n=1 Tax=Comamonas flocculans TaxID=2597701 RepID=A0A5B8RV92_9BURK|nr:flagellar hook-associated protein FlgK [Comamonas flocculans]QEA12584.1 flagellar hook-associated protein FlgK [Comamonas flocculans]
MSLLNVGARALLTNQVALQTTGHNIANVNTPGYSRQSAQLVTVQGQYTGSGYIGQGVAVQTILRNYNELLTRQAAMAGSVQAADQARSDKLNQLQDVFSGGASGLGAAITDMMNALSDVVHSPTDLTARTVALTRMDETAARMRASAQQIDDLQYTVNEQLRNDVVKINSLASNIAGVNEQIARARGNGQTPNDLLDRRDQLIRELNQYIQTTQVPADDGTMGLFVGGSQPLVLGTTATQLSVSESTSYPGSGQLALYFGRSGGTPIELNPDMLGGGEVAGLMRFSNNDLAEARNLLGRMAQAMGMALNAQNRLGLTLDGSQGGDLFALPASAIGYTSSATAAGSVSYTDATQFAASDYEVRFTGPNAGQVVRLSDGKTTAFTSLADPALQAIDGLSFNLTGSGNAGESILFKPFSGSASNVQALVYSPRDLAAANPVNAAMGTSNGGTLQLLGLQATGQPDPPGLVLPADADPAATPPIVGGVLLEFHAGPPLTYDAYDQSTPLPTLLATGPYVSGQPIDLNGWRITLQGTPQDGDTVTVGNALDPQYGDIYTRDAGNAQALMDLRDVQMFDNATLQDGWAGAMAQVGTRVQSAQYAAALSSAIADNLEGDRSAVSGVNLDEEAARLIQYQQAYQASAKVLQVAQSIFDTLIQTMGR